MKQFYVIFTRKLQALICISLLTYPIFNEINNKMKITHIRVNIYNIKNLHKDNPFKMAMPVCAYLIRRWLMYLHT